jgi:hypothetical protein
MVERERVRRGWEETERDGELKMLVRTIKGVNEQTQNGEEGGLDRRRMCENK